MFPKGLWTFIKSKDNYRIPPFEYVRNIYSDAEALNSYFCSVFTTRSCDNSPRIEKASFPPISCNNINVYEVQLLLENLNMQKSTGLDCIPPRLLKKLSFVAPALAHIFQPSMQQGFIPSHANMVPIFKKGNHSMPSNYCPVSLTSIWNTLSTLTYFLI